MILIIFVVLLLLVLMNVIIVFVGDKKMVKLVRVLLKNFVICYLILLFVLVFMFGNFMVYLMGCFLLEYYKFSWYVLIV